MRSWRHVAISFSLAGYYACAMASQSESPFQWGFNDQAVASTFSFSECQQLPLLIVPLNTTPTYYGIPPYYLFAFEPGGIPSVSMIGTDPKNLSWQNTHQRGASLMIMIQDSQRSTGGIDTHLYNVTAGSNTTCLSTSTTQPSAVPSIAVNATGKIETCQPWGLNIAGGEKPYTIVLTALDSSSVTNTSINDDHYTYINTVAPSELFMASVVDANGKWGISSPLVVSDGPNTTDCSTSTPTTPSSSAPAQQSPTTPAQKHDANHTPLIIGVSVAAGVVVVALLSAGLWWFFRRKSQRDRGTWDIDHSHLPDPFHPSQPDTDPDMQEDAYKPRPLLASSFSSQPAYSPLQTSLPDMDITPIPAIYFNREIEQARTAPTASAVSEPPSPVPIPAAPLTPRERKILEARRAQAGPASGLTSAPSSSSLPSSSLVDVAHTPDIPHEIFYQHRDGGTSIVHELPPPYADRTALHPSSPSDVS